MKITGIAETREVFVDGKPLSPAASQKVRNHSPDGFNWNYGGSGPAQLALALCLKAFGRDIATQVYQKFKWDVVAKLEGDFSVDVDMQKWLDQAYTMKLKEGG